MSGVIPTMSTEDYAKACATLGVPVAATWDDIRSAYRDLVKVWHPDRFGDDTRLREKAQRQLAIINEAYEYLRISVDPAGSADAAPSPSVPWRRPSGPPPKGPSKEPSYKTLWLGWLLIVILVVAGIVAINNYKSDPPNTANPATMTISTVPESQSELSVTEPTPLLCESVDRPPSSVELGGRHRGGLGKLSVSNGTDYDAVAVLTESDVPRRAIYIRNGETGIMTSIPRGRYQLRFQLGLNWQTDRRFCELKGTSEFLEEFEFDETELGSSIEYSTYEVTLHPVLAGTARTHAIPAGEFELPPL